MRIPVQTNPMQKQNRARMFVDPSAETGFATPRNRFSANRRWIALMSLRYFFPLLRHKPQERFLWIGELLDSLRHEHGLKVIRIHEAIDLGQHVRFGHPIDLAREGAAALL